MAFARAASIGERRAGCARPSGRCSAAASVSASSAARRRRRRRARRAAARSLSICSARTAALSTLSTSIGSSSVDAVLVDADHRLAAGVDAGLGAGRGLLDAQLRACRRRSPWPCRRPPRPPGCAPRPARPGRRSAARRSTLPPHGSITRVVPDSCCSSSWVLRAIRAEKSVGSASASSSALVCSDWVWPWVAAIASMQVRTTLLNTSCAVSDQPEVWQCVRSDSDLAFFGLELLRPAWPTAAGPRAAWRPP